MCLARDNPQPAAAPASAPPPPVDGATAPELNDEASSERNRIAANRRGRGSLRVNLASAQTGSSGSGLTIPGA